jgi:hypothetical protein
VGRGVEYVVMKGKERKTYKLSPEDDDLGGSLAS